jgi:nitrate/nitrite transporter NarK
VAGGWGTLGVLIEQTWLPLLVAGIVIGAIRVVPRLLKREAHRGGWMR